MATEAARPGPAANLAIPEVVRALVDVLGEAVVAVLAGVDDAGLVRQWMRGARAPRPPAARRLRAAVEVVRLLEEYEGPATIRAWWVGMNPDLGDEAPALMLARDPERVRAAALAFLAQ